MTRLTSTFGNRGAYRYRQQLRKSEPANDGWFWGVTCLSPALADRLHQVNRRMAGPSPAQNRLAFHWRRLVFPKTDPAFGTLIHPNRTLIRAVRSALPAQDGAASAGSALEMEFSSALRLVSGHDPDRARFLAQLAESKELYSVRLFLVCLMPNHFHLLLGTPGGNLSQSMGRLLTAYTVCSGSQPPDRQMARTGPPGTAMARAPRGVGPEAAECLNTISGPHLTSIAAFFAVHNAWLIYSAGTDADGRYHFQNAPTGDRVRLS